MTTAEQVAHSVDLISVAGLMGINYDPNLNIAASQRVFDLLRDPSCSTEAVGLKTADGGLILPTG